MNIIKRARLTKCRPVLGFKGGQDFRNKKIRKTSDLKPAALGTVA
jgi:hypothetical protein